IASTNDALEFLVAGADAVQIGTANFSNPQASREIVDGCLAYGRDHRLTGFSDLRWGALDHPGSEEDGPAGP
ncbi:MAG TPA: dihydroorotate dehydrogenase, partial [Candidatus Dormibacteraeota bacterium]